MADPVSLIKVKRDNAYKVECLAQSRAINYGFFLLPGSAALGQVTIFFFYTFERSQLREGDIKFHIQSLD